MKGYSLINTIRNISLASFLLFNMLCLAGYSHAEDDAIDTAYVEDIYFMAKEYKKLKVYNLQEFNVVHPDIVELLTDYSENQIELMALNEGVTTIFLVDDLGKRAINIYVSSENLELTRARMENLLKAVNIYELKLNINEEEGKIVILGDVPEKKQDQFDRIMEKFDSSIFLLSKPEVIDDLVQVDIKITELSTSFSKELGLDWMTGKQTVSGNLVSTTASNGFSQSYLEVLPNQDGSFGDMFKLGNFFRSDNSALVVKLNALITEGKGRVLSEPKLVVMSGEEASFLVGGEVPVRTSTTSQGGTEVSVNFKQYGVGMTVTPTIKRNDLIKNDKIDTLVSLQVSDIDAGNSGEGEVAFVTRNVSTRLLLDDGQTIVTAGLIKSIRGTKIKKIPFLGEVPVIGALFRNKTMPVADSDLELVITMTPHILYQQESLVKKRMKTNQNTSNNNTDARIQTQTVPPVRMQKNRIPPDMNEYVLSVQRKISEAIVYPSEAKARGLEGTVKLGLHILSDGTLAYALIKESSGYEVFDEYALNTAKNIAPYLNFPPEADLQELSVTIPIVYSLKNN